MGNVTLRMLVGAFAALLAWAIIEPTNPGVINQGDWEAFEIRLILAWGALIGMAVGGFNGYMQGGRLHIARGAGLGLVLGAVGAPLGYSIGGNLEERLFGPMMQIQATGNFATLVIARIVAIAPLGVLLGAAIGVSAWDYRRVLHGAIGGLLGAGLGALVFDVVGIVFAPLNQAMTAAQEVGQVPRATLSLCMGGFIALFIGLVEQIARTAWVRQALGRNEGREWALYGPRTLIGRNELAQIPIFGDPSVAPAHAMIDRRGPNEYWLADAGSGSPTYLNGQPVATAPLAHGSQIQVGNTVLQFLLKSGQALPANAYPQPIVQGYPAHPGMGQTPTPFTGQPTVAIPSPMAQTPTLVAMDGPLAGQRFPVTQPIELGREAAGIRLGFDTAASRRHAALIPGPQGVTVQDLGSTNGTFVNGQRITSVTIHPGDLVRIGATTFRLE